MDNEFEQTKIEALAKLEETYGKGNVMTTAEATNLYSFESFLAPFVVVRRKSDNVKGTLQFTHMPRFYFDFTPDSV